MLRNETSSIESDFYKHKKISSSKIDNKALFKLNLITRHHYYHYLYYFLNTLVVQTFINLCVIMNIIILCLDTYVSLRETYKDVFFLLNNFCLNVFLIEFLLKLILYKLDYFKNPFEIIDFLTLFIGVLEIIFILLGIETITSLSPSATTTTTTTTTIPPTLNSTVINDINTAAKLSEYMKSLRVIRIFRLTRGLRALRILKAFKLLKSLQIIIKTCINSFQSMGAIIILMTLVIFIFAVIGCGLFHKIDKENFGNIFLSIFTCIRLMTLDDWYKVYKTNKIENKEKKFEINLLIAYIFIYILIEYFIMLNLFLAVLVDNFQLAMKSFKSKQNLNKIENSTTIVDNDDYDEELNEIHGICHPFSKTLDPTLSENQQRLLERHFQLLATIEYYMHEKENIYQVLQYLVEETFEEDSKY